MTANAARLDVLAAESRMQMLANQLQPHFLFNALNGLTTLILREDTKAAQSMLESLADFLRALLRMGKTRVVSLRDELDMVFRYLRVENVRWGDRLDVRTEIEPVARDAAVPALLLQPLVENAIITGPLDADQLDLELIAFHSWAQDPHSKLTDAEAFDVFWRFFSETPVEPQRLKSRFMILTLERAVPKIGVVGEIFGKGDIVFLDDEKRAALRSGLATLLSTSDLWPENKIFLTLQSRQAVEVLEPESSPSRDELTALWLLAADAIDSAARELIAEFVTSEDTFAGRNFNYLQKVEVALLQWAESTENREVIDGLRTEVLEQCDRFKDEIVPAQYERCVAFLQGRSAVFSFAEARSRGISSLTCICMPI